MKHASNKNYVWRIPHFSSRKLRKLTIRRNVACSSRLHRFQLTFPRFNHFRQCKSSIADRRLGKWNPKVGIYKCIVQLLQLNNFNFKLIRKPVYGWTGVGSTGTFNSSFHIFFLALRDSIAIIKEHKLFLNIFLQSILFPFS